MFKLSKKSEERLEGVHSKLIETVKLAIQITPIDFTVLEGVRSLERQKHLVAIGASTTLNSRHLTGHAVDLGAWVDGTVAWDWPLYHQIKEAMFIAAEETKIWNDLEWGGSWKRFPDGPHFQLRWGYDPTWPDAG